MAAKRRTKAQKAIDDKADLVFGMCFSDLPRPVLTPFYHGFPDAFSSPFGNQLGCIIIIADLIKALGPPDHGSTNDLLAHQDNKFILVRVGVDRMFEGSFHVLKGP